MTDNDIIRCVFIPPVRCFNEVYADKAHALKVLEEAAEVFGAWQNWHEFNCHLPEESQNVRAHLVDECADVIQATCNLLYSIGVTDMALPMGACEQRNRERGRI